MAFITQYLILFREIPKKVNEREHMDAYCKKKQPEKHQAAILLNTNSREIKTLYFYSNLSKTQISQIARRRGHMEPNQPTPIAKKKQPEKHQAAFPHLTRRE